MSCAICRCADTGFCHCSCHVEAKAEAGVCQKCGEPAKLTLCYECADARVENTIKARLGIYKPLHNAFVEEIRESTIHHFTKADCEGLTNRLFALMAREDAKARPAPAANTEGLRERVAQEITKWWQTGCHERIDELSTRVCALFSASRVEEVARALAREYWRGRGETITKEQEDEFWISWVRDAEKALVGEPISAPVKEADRLREKIALELEEWESNGGGNFPIEAARICALFEGAGGLRVHRKGYCDDCGTQIIQDCPRCGAPNCCPKCCHETPIPSASPPPSEPSLREVGWLIEAPGPQWWDGFWFCTDSMDAVRFSRKLDAEKVIRETVEQVPTIQPIEFLAVEHAWSNAALARTPPQKPAETPASPEVEARREIARRFSGPEGDAAAEETGRIVRAVRKWRCDGCDKQLSEKDLVIDPGNNYFYHEKASGEICGRYVEGPPVPPEGGKP